MACPLLALFTDFALAGPYVGQMKAVLLRDAPGVPLVDLMHDAPAFDVAAAAHLLAALVPDLPDGAVVVAVVDPGVGTAARRPVVVRAAGRWLVGPGNGLFDPLRARAGDDEAWEITWRPARLSDSFHGRDLFAPVAARLARGEPPPGLRLDQPVHRDAADDLARVIYLDAYGNAMTGLRAAAVDRATRLSVGGRAVSYSRTFGEVPPGTAFWYANSLGLVEVAVNQGSAAAVLGIRVGAPVHASA